jgi:hypothetical protein
VIVNEPMSGFSGILGAPFLNQTRAKINFDQNSMNISVHQVKFAKRLKSNLHHCTSAEINSVSLVESLTNWNEVINEDNVTLRNAETINFPGWHVGMIKVQCPDEYRNELILVEPTTLPNSLVIGGAVIQPEKCAYVPVMNLSEEEVKIKRGTLVAHGAHIVDPRMLIGLEEEFTETEYVNFTVSRGKESSRGAVSTGTKEKVSRSEKPSERGRVNQKGVTKKQVGKEKLENLSFKGKPPKQTDLLDELELEQLDRLPSLKDKCVKDDQYVKETIDKMINSSECPDN